MNMSKKILMSIIILVMTFPLLIVSADDTKNVTVYCYCDYDGSNVTCSDNCSIDSLDEAIKNDCGGRNSTVDTVEYYCNPYASFGSITKNADRKGSNPLEACQNYVTKENITVNDKINLKVAAKATCTPINETLGEFICEEEGILNALKFAGYLLFFAKLLVPFIIIVMGTMDYYKAVVSDSDKDLSKQTKVFIKRIVLGIIIFFIPAILNTFMVFISDYNEVAEKYEVCVSCALDPLSCNN